VNLSAPERGSVIRYAYLWADENAAGREEGRKDRPVVVLALSIHERDGKTRLLVVPVTHSPIADPRDGVPVPENIKSRIGLDKEPAWIITTEANAFTWPGPDIRPIPRRRPRTIFYGRIPDGLLRQVARSYLANRERQQGRLVSRTE
jgi:hypothetical protein